MSNHESSGHENDASTTSRISYWCTGGGYLVFRIYREYDPNFDNEFVVGRRLLGVAAVDDREQVQRILKTYGFDPEILDELPVYEAPDEG